MKEENDEKRRSKRLVGDIPHVSSIFFIANSTSQRDAILWAPSYDKWVPWNSIRRHWKRENVNRDAINDSDKISLVGELLRAKLLKHVSPVIVITLWRYAVLAFPRSVVLYLTNMIVIMISITMNCDSFPRNCSLYVTLCICYVL